MFRNLLLIGLLFVGTLLWLSPSFTYLDLVNPLGNPIPRYSMEVSLILTYTFTLGTFLLVGWLLLWMNQYESPAEMMMMALLACFGWDMGMRYSLIKTFYYNEPVPCSVSILLFHLIFTALFGAYLYIHEEWNRLNFEAKFACYLQAGASAVLLISLFSNPFVALIYCFASMVSLWLGIQAIFSSTRRSLKMNLVAVLIPLPGFLILLYLLLAPHISNWAGAKILGYRPEGFYTQLTILGKPLSPQEEKLLQLTNQYKEKLNADAQRYRHSAKLLVLFFLLGIVLKSRKKIVAKTEKLPTLPGAESLSTEAPSAEVSSVESSISPPPDSDSSPKNPSGSS